MTELCDCQQKCPSRQSEATGPEVGKCLSCFRNSKGKSDVVKQGMRKLKEKMRPEK